MGLSLACVALGASVALAATTGMAQSRDATTGSAAFAAAHFDEAEAAFERVLRDGGVTAADLVEAHRHLAVLRGAAGDEDQSERHATWALALDPRAAVPEGTSPPLVTLFERLRAERHGERARVAIGMPRAIEAGREAAVRVGTRGERAWMGLRVTLRCTGDGAQAASSDFDAPGDGSPVPVAALPAGATLRCEATLATPEGVVIDRAEAAREVRARASRTSPGVYLLAGAGLVAVAALVVVVAHASADATPLVNLGPPRIMP